MNAVRETIIVPPVSRWDQDTWDGYHASLNSLEDLIDLPSTPVTTLLALEHIVEHAVHLGPSVYVICIAFDAGEAVGSIKPTEEYLADIAAAVAAQFDEFPITVEYRHGWPILSLEGAPA